MFFTAGPAQAEGMRVGDRVLRVVGLEGGSLEVGMCACGLALYEGRESREVYREGNGNFGNST